MLQREYGFPGVTAAYVLPDGTVGEAAVGMADVELGVQMTPSSTMLAASVGKMFVAATALSLASENRLDLDDPASYWLDRFPWFRELPNHRTITVRHLLNHTSGLANHVESETFLSAFAARWSDTREPMGVEELISYVLDQPSQSAPGEAWSYSDTGYLLVGLIIEEVSGRSYYEEVTTRFLGPLGLRATVPSDRLVLPDLATGYVATDNLLGLPRRTVSPDGTMVWHPGIEWTGGGLASRPSDLVRWARALFVGEALDGAYLGDLLAAFPVVDGGSVAYGLGVAIHQSETLGPVYGHGGWIPGYITSLRYYADHRIGIAFQINTDQGLIDGAVVDEIEQRLATLVIDSPEHPGEEGS